jgi:hypothetical protein
MVVEVLTGNESAPRNMQESAEAPCDGPVPLVGKPNLKRLPPALAKLRQKQRREMKAFLATSLLGSSKI